VKVDYEKLSSLDKILERVIELSPATVIMDVEPLVAHWNSTQQELDRGLALVVSRAEAQTAIKIICFASNSARHPSVTLKSESIRVVYLNSAHKPLRIRPYERLPRPGIVVGDQILTDGLLAGRLGYMFLYYDPQLRNVPIWPRVMKVSGSLLGPFIFRKAG
jgi:predicted HAD superfamily phosphohydrolase YqeG